MNPIDKARILKKLEAGYCVDRKVIVRDCGAVQDYWVMNFIVSHNGSLNAQLPRSEVIAVINEWAEFIPEPSRILTQ